MNDTRILDLAKNPPRAKLQGTVMEQFANVAPTPEREEKFPLGPASGRRPSYDPNVIDSLEE